MTSKGFNLSYSLFNSPHFDAFQNFMLLVNEKIVTNGKQLVDAIFFLKDNRIGSGHILGEQVGFTFFNIAMPFLGEGFINFSYLGVVVFTLFISFLNSFFDKNYINFPIPFKSIYFVLIGFEFYILRGDLSSSVKKMTGFIFALLIVVFTSYIFKKLNKKA
ncbi:O-antigen polysaccharide polymerase Wzy [Tenacibaculum aquimarinum]|uniref:O-antigen polysaccharide polymerase Wzy n=1 Tax=Tenacibaculum aquimarinum TaxID=2910675 RepID=UPI001F0A32F5|nr:O-antigen polysaccharide polymerase Wzy [Tenacibaculum aquimarinum]MCH3884625.1 O-antigen polysaccharide polymerase Wzy [Tenacibaculum aquimarinum]